MKHEDLCSITFFFLFLRIDLCSITYAEIKSILLCPAIELVLWYMTSNIMLEKKLSLCYSLFLEVTLRTCRDYFVIFYLEVKPEPGQLLPIYEIMTKLLVYIFNIEFDGNNVRQVCNNSSLLSLFSSTIYV